MTLKFGLASIPALKRIFERSAGKVALRPKVEPKAKQQAAPAVLVEGSKWLPLVEIYVGEGWRLMGLDERPSAEMKDEYLWRKDGTWNRSTEGGVLTVRQCLSPDILAYRRRISET